MSYNKDSFSDAEKRARYDAYNSAMDFLHKDVRDAARLDALCRECLKYERLARRTSSSSLRAYNKGWYLGYRDALDKFFDGNA